MNQPKLIKGKRHETTGHQPPFQSPSHDSRVLPSRETSLSYIHPLSGSKTLSPTAINVRIHTHQLTPLTTVPPAPHGPAYQVPFPLSCTVKAVALVWP